jgi:sarcosine oxidase, subunit beta
MDTADVVVIGAGANGASTAFHLAKLGAGRVIVVEQGHLAAGASGKSGALVRTSYANEPETRLAIESIKYFANWRDMVGGDCGFQRIGLLTFTPPEYRDRLEARVAMHRELGVDARLIRPEDARELDPSLYVDDVELVEYEPDSGYADPNATVFGFARAATALGVEFRLGTRVSRILTEGERVTGVATSGGTIQTPVVVVAAGAWANSLFAPLGIDLGLVPIEAQVVVFRWAAERSPRHLTYIDSINGSWMRPIDGNCTLIGSEGGVKLSPDPDNYPETVRAEYIAQCRAALSRRVPAMQYATMRGNWAGILMFSPDSRPIIDKLPGYDGLFCMTGDSGTSFKTSPAIGKCLAEWVVQGRATTVDLTPFRATRFAEGQLWEDENEYGPERKTISR